MLIASREGQIEHDAAFNSQVSILHLPESHAFVKTNNTNAVGLDQSVISMWDSNPLTIRHHQTCRVGFSRTEASLNVLRRDVVLIQ